MSGFDLRRAERLNRFLDERGHADAAARRAEAFDPAIVRAINRLDALDDAPDADSAFANRLLEEIMTTAHIAVAPGAIVTAPAPSNGRLARWIAPLAAPPDLPRSRRGIGQLATAALVVLVLAASLFMLLPGRQSGQDALPAYVPAISATPATPAPAAAPTVEFVWETSGGPDLPFEGMWFPLNVDPEGNLWVLDGPRHQFQIFAPDGTWLESWGTPGSGPGEFDFLFEQDPLPSAGDVAFDENGNIYVVDSGNSRVQKFAPDRSYIAAWGSEGNQDGQFLYPGGIARDANGLLYVSDLFRADVQVFDSDGRYVRTIGGRGRDDGQLEAPGSPVLDADGHLWIVDFGRDTIQEFSPDGALLSAWSEREPGDLTFDPGELHGVGDIAIDDQNRIFVPDSVGASIQIFSSDGEYLTSWGESGDGPGQFRSVTGVLLDGNGFAYVSDVGNHRIQKFRLSPPFGPGEVNASGTAPSG
jgi:hypothetical protein